MASERTNSENPTPEDSYDSVEKDILAALNERIAARRELTAAIDEKIEFLKACQNQSNSKVWGRKAALMVRVLQESEVDGLSPKEIREKLKGEDEVPSTTYVNTTLGTWRKSGKVTSISFH